MCKVLGINRSTYYKYLNHVKSNRDAENQKLDNDILAIYYDTKRRYGAPKIHHELLENRPACQFKTSTAKNGIAWNPFNCNQEISPFFR